MEKEILLNDKWVKYDFTRKKVKNINLRIRADGSIVVSAGKWVSQKTVEDFLRLKADFILNALKKLEEKEEKTVNPYFDEEEIKAYILKLCEEHYPYFAKYCSAYPAIKFKRMVSRWGSCNRQKGILCFNVNLMYAPPECVEYVVLHEFCHFRVSGHQKDFYDALSSVCPEWKKLRYLLKGINVR